MATFGNISDGTGYWDGHVANGKSVAQFTLSEAGSVSKLTVRLENNLAGHAACHLKGLIYSDTADAPDDLLATGDAVAITDNIGYTWIDLTFASPVALSAGDYWLGMIGDASGAGVGYNIITTGGVCGYYADTYSDGPTDPFGAINARVYLMSIYATYTPGGAGEAPTVTTTAITAITATTATGGGTITDSGDSALTAYGVCWNTSGTPTTADAHTHDGP